MMSVKEYSRLALNHARITGFKVYLAWLVTWEVTGQWVYNHADILVCKKVMMVVAPGMFL